MASLFDEVAGGVSDASASAPAPAKALDFDEDLLEDDVAQVLRDTAHLAQEEGRGEGRA